MVGGAELEFEAGGLPVLGFGRGRELQVSGAPGELGTDRPRNFPAASRELPPARVNASVDLREHLRRGTRAAVAYVLLPSALAAGVKPTPGGGGMEAALALAALGGGADGSHRRACAGTRRQVILQCL